MKTKYEELAERVAEWLKTPEGRTAIEKLLAKEKCITQEPKPYGCQCAACRMRA